MFVKIFKNNGKLYFFKLKLLQLKCLMDQIVCRYLKSPNNAIRTEVDFIRCINPSKYVCLFWACSHCCRSEHAGGPIDIHGERHRSGPRYRRQRSLLFPASFFLLCHRRSPRHRHRHQNAGLWDNSCLPAHRKRHGQLAYYTFHKQPYIYSMCIKQSDCVFWFY